MKRFYIAIAAALAAACLLTACGPRSSSQPEDSSSQPTASSSQPAPTTAPSSSPSQPQSGSSLPPESSSSSSQASSSQPQQQEWAGTYAREPGSAGQIMLYITQETSEGFHFKFDAKGLIFEGDAVVAGDTATYSGKDGYALTFYSGQTIVIEQTGVFEGGNVSFDGEFESAGR